MATLKAQHLAKSYKSRQVVRDVSLSIDSGQIVGLLGPNGAGKTTLMRAHAGLHRPVKGGITFKGRDLSRLDAAQI
uniref:ATP-binding cassette domain-containing protein n=1 Tax=Pandoraea sputorum TaxID=93222 RepID=UPI003555D3AB